MDNLRQLQQVELDILKEVLKIFEKHNITYFALGGTMLGAVRHQGFIPWDDDIDIGVPREDYEQLNSIFEELPKRLKYCSFELDSTYPYYFARVEDEQIIVKSVRAEEEELTPAWVDIFPLDGMPNNPVLRKLHACRVLYARMIFQVSRFNSIVNVKRTNRPMYEKVIIMGVKKLHINKWVSNEKSFQRLDRILKRYSTKKSQYYLNGMGAYKLRELHEKRVFGNGTYYPFEDIKISGPQDFETYLTQLYGDWRTPADLTHHEVTEVFLKGE